MDALAPNFGHNSRGEKSRYAITFDLDTAALKVEYGDPCDQAHYEVERELENFSFGRKQGSVYLYSGANGLVDVYRAINRLSSIGWFKKSVRDIRAFKVEDWSDFTEIVKSA